MAELADALDSGSSEGNFMQVQVLFPAPVRVFVGTLGFLLGQVSVMNIGTSESVFMDALLFSPINPVCQKRPRFEAFPCFPKADVFAHSYRAAKARFPPFRRAANAPSAHGAFSLPSPLFP